MPIDGDVFIQRANVLGVGVSAINMGRALDMLDHWITHDERNYVCVTGVHGVMESQRHPELRQIHNAAGLVTPDGMPLVWLLKLEGHKSVDRVYGPDLMLATFERSQERRYKNFLYGSSEQCLSHLRGNLQRRYPGVPIVGTHSPPYRSLTEEEDDQVVDMINSSGAQIVWVGLSTPKQEQWMSAHRGRLNAPVLIGVGAAFDIHAGLLRQAPRAFQRCGLEWLYRMAMEPKRLWRRYLANNPRFVLSLLGQKTGLVRYSIDV